MGTGGVDRVKLWANLANTFHTPIVLLNSDLLRNHILNNMEIQYTNSISLSERNQHFL